MIHESSSNTKHALPNAVDWTVRNSVTGIAARRASNKAWFFHISIHTIRCQCRQVSQIDDARFVTLLEAAGFKQEHIVVAELVWMGALICVRRRGFPTFVILRRVPTCVVRRQISSSITNGIIVVRATRYVFLSTSHNTIISIPCRLYARFTGVKPMLFSMKSSMSESSSSGLH